MKLFINSPPFFHFLMTEQARRYRIAFSTIELLVAVVIFSVLATALATLVNSALNIWSKNEKQTSLEQRARNITYLMTRDLQQALTTPFKFSNRGPQMLINSEHLAGVALGNHLFFQAPIATSRTKSDLAVVGYFIRKGGDDGNTYQLCRLFLNSDEPGYPAPEADATQWLTPALLDQKAYPAASNYYQGLVAEDVPGLWIRIYQDDTELTSYDSRANGNVLPSHLNVSLALLDLEGAQRLKAGQFNLPDPNLSKDALDYQSQLPEQARRHVKIIMFNILY